MSRSRTTRLLAVSVVTTLVAGLLALIGVGLGPAQADHDGLAVEVTREVTNVNQGAIVTLTARLVTSDGVPPTPDYAPGFGAGVEIDWEFEGNASNWDGENGAATPEDPDKSCFIVAPSEDDPTSWPPQCSITIGTPAGPDGSPPAVPVAAGEALVRAWIDHDHRDGNQTSPRGGTEADLGETRLSGDGDCLTELEYIPEDQSDEAYAACTSETDTAGEGDTPEFDDTDVVRVIIKKSEKATKLICPSREVTIADETAVVDCLVLSADNDRVGGQIVDAKHISGANDPDSGDSDKDYTGTSNDNGIVRLEIPSDDGDLGFGLICAWIDEDSADDGDGIPFIGEDPEFDNSSEGRRGDGANCGEDAAATDELAEEDGATAPFTDAFYVEWQEAQLTALDVTPETGSSTVGSTHTLTARVFDQVEGAWNSPPVQVKFEFMSGSAADSDGTTLNTPDLTCTTPGNGAEGGNTCTVSYTATRAGNDTVCAWITTPADGAVTSSCDGETPGGNQGGEEVDVVTKTWTVQQTSTAPEKPDQGYSLVGGDGGIFNYGNAEFHGSTGNLKLNQPIIGIAYMPGGTGYWLVAKDGGVFTFGAAKFWGSMGDKKLNAPVLGMEATPTGRGYYLFAADGGIFTFGDAEFHGSTGDMKLNAPMIGMAVTSTGKGYWLVAQDGGVFTFNAPFYGSTGDKKLNEPVFDMGAAPGNAGYWLVARDGGIFTFGNVAFYGSAANVPGRSTVVGIGVTPAGKGYWVADVNGKVMPFGDAKFYGDRSTSANNAPMVGFAAVPKG